MTPDRLGPYRIVSKLGRGGMGMVFLGVDDAAGETAAVKLLAGDMASHSDFRERFRAEIDTLRTLHHPNIVQIFGYGEQDDQIYYAMEYVSGSSLEASLPAAGRLTGARSPGSASRSPWRCGMHMTAASSIATSSRAISCLQKTAC